MYQKDPKILVEMDHSVGHLNFKILHIFRLSDKNGGKLHNQHTESCEFF